MLEFFSIYNIYKRNLDIVLPKNLQVKEYITLSSLEYSIFFLEGLSQQKIFSTLVYLSLIF